MSGANFVHTVVRDLEYAADRPRNPKRRRRGRRGANRDTRAFRARGPGLGAFLRACRLREGRGGRREWSLRSVARRAEMSFSTLSQIETGQRRAMARHLLRLAAVLGEDGAGLLARAGYQAATASSRPAFALTAAERALIERLRARPQLVAPLRALVNALG